VEEYGPVARSEWMSSCQEATLSQLLLFFVMLVERGRALLVSLRRER
jgi:hypothetical protein